MNETYYLANIPIRDFVRWLALGWRIVDDYAGVCHGEWSVIGRWDHGEPVKTP